MIYHIRKNIYKFGEDFVIKPIGGEFLFKVTSIKKGYYLYDKNGLQVGQITFEKGKASIVAPESSAIIVYKNDYSYSIDSKQIDDENPKEQIDKTCFKENKVINMIFGTPNSYKYDIYEKSEGKKQPEIVANIIPDVSDNNFYKIRINGGENILKLIMVILAIDKLNSDPNNRY